MADILSHSELASFASDSGVARRKGAGAAFLKQWAAKGLEEALRTKDGKKITIKRVVGWLAEIAEGGSRDSDRLSACERLLDLIKLGAVQDTVLSAHVRGLRKNAVVKASPTAASDFDFKPKIVKEADGSRLAV